jgi:hypothetical protein
MMNCYAGLAKRIAKCCFPKVKLPKVIPVSELQPHDSKNIIKQEVKDINTNRDCLALSDEENLEAALLWAEADAWEAALVWLKLHIQVSEAAAIPTNTDESYKSHDFEDEDNIEEFEISIWEKVAALIAIWCAKERAATTIQAAARRRAAKVTRQE